MRGGRIIRSSPSRGRQAVGLGAMIQRPWSARGFRRKHTPQAAAHGSAIPRAAPHARVRTELSHSPTGASRPPARNPPPVRDTGRSCCSAGDIGTPLPADGRPPAGLAEKYVAYFHGPLARARAHTLEIARSLADADLERETKGDPPAPRRDRELDGRTLGALPDTQSSGCSLRAGEPGEAPAAGGRGRNAGRRVSRAAPRYSASALPRVSGRATTAASTTR